MILRKLDTGFIGVNPFTLDVALLGDSFHGSAKVATSIDPILKMSCTATTFGTDEAGFFDSLNFDPFHATLEFSEKFLRSWARLASRALYDLTTRSRFLDPLRGCS